MLCCPARSPRSLSKRLPGGTLSSRIPRTRFIWVSFRRTTGHNATGQARRARRVDAPLNRSSVAWFAKDAITSHIITDTVIIYQITVPSWLLAFDVFETPACSFRIVFQFRAVPGVPNTLSMAAAVRRERPMPSGYMT